MVEGIDDPEDETEVNDGAEDAVQVDVHYVLEELPLPDIVTILKEHGRQQEQDGDIPEIPEVFLVAEEGRVEEEDGHAYDAAAEDGHCSLMDVIALC